MKTGGNWIWFSGEESPRNFYLYCRKTFTLRDVPATCLIRMTADSLYRVFVNGAPAGRGPVRGDHENTFVDAWDIAPLLRKGRNVIAVLVHHYGEDTYACIHRRGGLLAWGAVPQKGRTREVVLDTDDTWRVCPSQAWRRDLQRITIQTGFPEDYDARLAPLDWTSADYDDSTWEPATLVCRAGEGPWPRLVPRDIPPLYEGVIHAASILETGDVTPWGMPRHAQFGTHDHSHRPKVVYFRTSLFSPIRQKATLTFGTVGHLRVLLRGTRVHDFRGERPLAPDADQVTVTLEAGWNRVLAKVFTRELYVRFHLRAVPENEEGVRIACREDRGDPPFAALGPFFLKDEKDYEKPLPPETDDDLNAAHAGADGKPLTWQFHEEAFPRHQSVAVHIEYARRAPLRQGRLTRPRALLARGAGTVFTTRGRHGVHATLDFGREVVGFPRLAIKGARGGEVVALGYSELLEHGRVVPNRCEVRYADRYIARPGDQSWEAFDKRAFRYLQIDVYNAPQGLTIEDLSLNFTTYDVAERGRFESSDDRLNRIWEIGAWTVQLNMEDAYTDCPWRERAQWLGDLRIEGLCNFYAFGDELLLRRGIRQMAISRKIGGLIQGCYPNDAGHTLPPFALIWALCLDDHHQQTGDRRFAREMLPALKDTLAFFEKHTNRHGMVQDPPGWNFVDWTPLATWGEAASVNGLYILALDAGARLGRVAGETALANRWSRRAETLRQNLRERLWDAEAGILRETRNGDAIFHKYSQNSTALAVLAGVLTGEEAAQALRTVLTPAEFCVEIGTPYFAFYFLDALFQAGLRAEALDYLRVKWGAMLDAGATTWWEHWTDHASLCHGWSAAPTYFLSREILGVRNAAPGWRRVRVEPWTAGLTSCRGAVPLPQGDLRAAWTVQKRGVLRYDLELPEKTTAEVLLPGVPAEAPGGRAPRALDGRRGWIVKGPGTFVFRSRLRED